MDEVRGAYEAVVPDVERAPQFLEDRGDLIAVRLLVHAFFPGDAFDVLTVLVGAGKEEHIVAVEAAGPGEGIGRDRAIGVAGVGHVVHVIDRRGVEEGAFAQGVCDVISFE